MILQSLTSKLYVDRVCSSKSEAKFEHRRPGLAPRIMGMTLNQEGDLELRDLKRERERVRRVVRNRLRSTSPPLLMQCYSYGCRTARGITILKVVWLVGSRKTPRIPKPA